MTNKIAINGRFLSRRISGVERYAHEISKRIHPNRVIRPGLQAGQIRGNLWEQITLPMQIAQDEILWSPANAGPWLVRNQVLTIHDASVFDHPEWFKPSFAAWTRLSWRILARRVKAIITVSNFSRDRLIVHLGIPAEKIHVIYNGVGHPFTPQPQKKVEMIRKKYNLDKPYFLSVGTNEPRKNLPLLLKAWKNLGNTSHMLLLAGGQGHVFSSTDPGISTYVDDEDLPALYAGATAYVTTSHYEGFGLPALEAMACGAPVIAPNTTAFPEILGDAALLFTADHFDEISKAIQKIIDEPQIANTLRERGLEHVKNFTWERAAQQTQSLLENLS
jgi:glycosyltransferase involved in cell wall biosynthesis